MSKHTFQCPIYVKSAVVVHHYDDELGWFHLDGPVEVIPFHYVDESVREELREKLENLYIEYSSIDPTDD